MYGQSTTIKYPRTPTTPTGHRAIITFPGHTQIFYTVGPCPDVGWTARTRMIWTKRGTDEAGSVAGGDTEKIETNNIKRKTLALRLRICGQDRQTLIAEECRRPRLRRVRRCVGSALWWWTLPISGGVTGLSHPSRSGLSTVRAAVPSP